MRAGGHALSLLSVPLNVQVLTALADGPMTLIDLRRAIGSPPQTTMRGHLRNLVDTGILERHRQTDFPGSVDYELGKAGRDLISVGTISQCWLATAPDGPIELGSSAAKSSMKAFVECWTAGVVRALAARPFSLTELSKLITSISYPSLERRLVAMRLTGQIERCPGDGRSGTPYKVTPWLCSAVAPLAAATRWERRHLPERTAQISRIDIEAAFLLAAPLLRFPSDVSGICGLAVESQDDTGETRLAGVTMTVEAGRVGSCLTRLVGRADTRISGSAAAWLRAVIDRQDDQLEARGDSELGQRLPQALHGILQPVGAR